MSSAPLQSAGSGQAAIDFAAGKDTVLHVWMKPLEEHAAAMQVVLDDKSIATLSAGHTYGHGHARLTLPEAGAAQLTWDPSQTDCRIAYVYDRESVLTQGIHLLHVGEPARVAHPPGALGFRPPFGWMNDPNGFCYIDGRYHLFYQHNPLTRRWDKMHWGHAVSRDLLHWTHLPVFLQPDPKLRRPGGAFSGSALSRADGGLDVFYTDHCDGRRPEVEVQRHVASADLIQPDDRGRVVISARPPLDKLRVDFRDPFVTIGPDGRRRMVLGSRDRKSALLLLYIEAPDGTWQFSGVLHREGRFGGVAAECPVFLPLGPADDPQTVWVLIFGLLRSHFPETSRYNVTLALTGRFDGEVFTLLAERALDFGPDAYAFQACIGPDGPVGLAWAANWVDVDKSQDLETAMTLPRRLVLADDGQTLLTPLAAVPAPGSRQTIEAPAGNVRHMLPGPAAAIQLETAAGPEPLELLFDGPAGAFVLRLAADELQLTWPGGRVSSCPIGGAGAHEISAVLYAGAIEVYVDGGRQVFTRRLEAAGPFEALTIRTGTARIAHLEICGF